MVDGIRKNISKRHYCLACSPFGAGNRKQLTQPFSPEQKYICGICGETDSNKFYGHKTTVCAECHKNYTTQKGLEKREWAINQLGGKCVVCGYNEYSCSLDIHHLDPSIKDVNFRSMRGWSLDRIKRELENCILLCKNHHQAFHSGHDIFNSGM